MKNIDFYSFLVETLEAAGVIGAYVALSLVGVSILTYYSNDRITKKIQSAPTWSHSILGSLLGVIPGCGGTIVASTLYSNKKLSFGGLLAAFITTLGEGSFVLLGASAEADVAYNFKAFATVTITGVVVGIIIGSLFDAFNFKRMQHDVNHDVIAGQDDSINQKSRFQEIIENSALLMILGTAFFLAPGSILALWGESIESIQGLTISLCIVLSLISISYYIMQTFLLDGHCHSENHTNIKSVLLESVIDISMVITYIFIGLFIANFVIDIVVGPEQFHSWMNSSALLVVVLSALIGATPGCGGMIAVAVAYVTIQDFPIAALISAGIATSGDGIFPLLANNKKDALIITGVSLLTAIIVGYASLLFRM